MMTTEDQLIEELREQGCNVKKRRLTDWRAKGLLPELSSRGQGKGRGKLYFWSEPDILQHALTVYELLKWYARFDETYLPLWLLGYPAPLDIVRRKLAEWYRNAVRQFTKEMSEDGLENTAEKLALNDLGWSEMPNARGRQYHVFFGSFTPFENILKAFSDPDFEMTEDDREEMMDELRDVAGDLTRYARPAGIQSVLLEQPAIYRACIESIQRYCRPRQVARLIHDSTDNELRRCNRDMRLLSDFLQNTARLLNQEAFWKNVKFTLVIGLAPYVVLTDLGLRRNGHAGTVNYIIREIVDMTQRLTMDEQLRAGSANAEPD